MATSFVTSGQVLHWPVGIRPATITLYPQSNTARFQSPFSRTTQTQANPGALFRLSAQFPPMDGAKAGQARALLARLRGSAGRFYFPAERCSAELPAAGEAERRTSTFFRVDTTHIRVDSTDSSTTADRTLIYHESLITVTSSTATTITGTLVPGSNRAPLRVGQHISFDDTTGWRHLHLVVGIETSGSTITLTVEPPMRALPTAATSLHITYPSGIFMLVDDDQGATSMGPGGKVQFAFEAVQAFPLKVVA